MIVYNSIKDYINSSEDLKSKIERIEIAINAMLDKLLDVAGNADVKEIQLDTGQMKTRQVFANVADLERSINALEKLKNIYLNRLTGRTFRLVDGKNFY